LLAGVAGAHTVAHESAAPPLTTVIVVRHAERGPDEGPLSPITEKGRERANELARVLEESGINRILVSEFLRTQQTVEPLAQRLKLQPEIVPQQKGTDALAARIRESAGQTILVSSHRSRIEPLLERLGAGKMDPIPDPEYDNLFVLTLPGAGPAKLVTLKYGAR
jgi:broad specificity phosphatase PhoE